jgi:hypothetical protein
MRKEEQQALVTVYGCAVAAWPHPAVPPITLCPSCQARLVALVAAQQLSIPMSDMEQRLEALMVMLPDLGGCRGLNSCWVGGGPGEVCSI